MSLPASYAAISDLTFGQTATTIDAEILRQLVLGVKKVRAITVTLTVPANATTSSRITAYSNPNAYFIVKSIASNVAGNVHIFVDGVESVIPVSANTVVDLSVVYGSTVYGSTVEVVFELPSPASSQTSVTVVLYGAETRGLVQTPTTTVPVPVTTS